jgi:galactonate dehydratase
MSQETVQIARVEPLSVQVTARTTWVFVVISDRSGMQGLGEATLEGQSDEVLAAIRRHGESLLGAAFRHGSEAARWTVARLDDDSGLIEAAALSAIEQALQDLLARARGERLAEALGCVLRDPVPMYANINRGTTTRQPGQFAERAVRAARQGFAGVKLAPFDGLTPAACATLEGRRLIDAGLARIAATREALDADGFSDQSLMVDCHWRFSMEAARAMVGELARLRVDWYECPLPETPEHFADLRALRALANERGMRLAGAELMIGLPGFLPLLRAGLYDVVMPDVKYAGGLEETLRIAAACVRHGTACSPHNPSGPICHAHSLHVASVMPNMPLLEVQFEETPRFAEIVDANLPQFEGGASALPKALGLGVRLLDLASGPTF